MGGSLLSFVGTEGGRGGLRNTVLKSFSWLSLARIIKAGFSFLTTLILVRLLDPKDFGLMAAAAVALNLLSILNNFGVASAIVQSKKLHKDDISSVFWPSIGLGILLFLVAVALSNFVAQFFGTEGVRTIFIALSFSLIMQSFGSLQEGLLRRRFEFKILAIKDLVGYFSYGIVALVGAVLGFGVWALVMGSLIQSLVQNVILWFVVSWRPSFVFNVDAFKRLFGFGLKLAANGVVNYFRTNTDRALVGRILGASQLGIYQIALNFAMMPKKQIAPLLGKVLLPAYSKIRDDSRRLESAYLQSIRYVSFFLIPASFGLAVVAPEFIKVFFGEKWIETIVPLQYLSIAGGLLSLNPVVGNVLVAKGKLNVLLRWNIIRTVITVGLLVAGATLGGINGVAAAFTLSVAIDLPIFQYISVRSVKGKLSTLWVAIAPVFISAVVMGILVLLLRAWLLTLETPKIVVLFTSVLFGIIIYLLALRLMRFRVLSEIISAGVGIVREYFKRWRY